MSAPQSASAKPWMDWLVEEVKRIPKARVPATYQRSLFTTFQWWIWGLCMYWETLLTAYVMSGRVKVKYWRAPIVWRYKVGSWKTVEPSTVSLRDVTMGVGCGLASVMLALCNNCWAYLSWWRISDPSEFHCVSIPRK